MQDDRVVDFTTCAGIVDFYSSCRAPTEREKLKRSLKMDNDTWEIYEAWLDGKSDDWLILS
jgi:hypothetical protein